MDKIIKFLERISKAKTWKKVVLSLSSVVVFITVYALILPAITVESSLKCELQEHAHGDECYSISHTINCGLEESEGHVHNEGCYKINQKLICELEESDEHTHGEGCYVEEKELTCTLEESGHHHSGDCYEDNKVLTCTLEEHTHLETCYEDVQKDIVKEIESFIMNNDNFDDDDDWNQTDINFGGNTDPHKVIKSQSNNILVTSLTVLDDGRWKEVNGIWRDDEGNSWIPTNAYVYDFDNVEYSITITDFYWAKDGNVSETNYDIHVRQESDHEFDNNQFNVKELNEQEIDDICKTMFENSGDNYSYKFYDITLTNKSNLESHYDVTFKGLLEKNNQKFKLYYVDLANNHKELIKENKGNGDGSITFTTNHFSIYGVVIEEPAKAGIGNEDDFSNVFNSRTGNNEIYFLTNNVTVSADKKAKINRPVTLDLNGYTLEAAGRIFEIGEGGKLTIIDSQANGETIATVSPERNYGNVATYNKDSKTLTYYVTKPNITAKGFTSETVEQHTVVGQGLITTSDECDATPIYINGGELTLQSGMIAGSNARAIYINDAAGASLHLEGGYIAGNNVSKVNTKSGGAIYVNGAANIDISGTVIAGNTADERGGGIAINGGTLTIRDNAVISGNILTKREDSERDEQWEATVFGGAGVYAANTTINMTGGYVTNNRFNGEYYFDGGGGFLVNQSNLNITGNAKITGNYSRAGGGGIKTVRGQQSIIKMNGGFISSNHANGAEGGGISFDNASRGYIDGGYITNNSTRLDENPNEYPHWGGGGLFCSDGDAQIYLYNAMITENNAGGYGGGVAGCSTGRVAICDEDGAAIYKNGAEGVHLSGDESAKNDDRVYAATHEAFYNNGYQDYYCALASQIDGGMLGGGTSNWTGSADGVAITSTSKDDILTATYIMGLTAHPSQADIANAQNIATTFISGNYSNTHGGGILANGYLYIGSQTDTTLPARIELIGTKDLLNKDGEAIQFAEHIYTFNLTDENGDIVAIGTNQFPHREDGTSITNSIRQNIVFDRRLPFDKVGTFTYYLSEVNDAENNHDNVVYDSTVYRITVKTVEGEKIVNKDINGHDIINHRILLDNIKVERQNNNGEWKEFYNNNPGNDLTHPVEFHLSNEDSKLAVFNNYEVTKINYKVIKKWAGGNGSDSVTVHLMRNGQQYKEPAVLNAGNNWTYTWTDLDTVDGDMKYSYYIQEEGIPGYLASYQYVNDAGPVTTSRRENQSFSAGTYWVPIVAGETLNPNTEYAILSSDGEHAFGIYNNEDTNKWPDNKPIFTGAVTGRFGGSFTVNGTTYSSWYAGNAITDAMTWIPDKSYTNGNNQNPTLFKHKLYESWFANEGDGNAIKTTNGKIYGGAVRLDNSGHLRLQRRQLAHSYTTQSSFGYVVFNNGIFENSGSAQNGVVVYKKITTTSRITAQVDKTSTSVGTGNITATITNTNIHSINYRLNIRKVAESNINKALKDAKFNILDEQGQAMTFVLEDGFYIPNNEGTTDLLISNANGYIRIKDLKGGDYTITEIEAPSGYGLAEDQQISLNETTTDSTLNITIEDPDKQYSLPMTGGRGTTMLYIAGGFMMVGAAILYIAKKRTDAK